MKATTLKRLFNWYGPYLGAGVRVEEISPDWRYCRVAMRLAWYNKNAVGTHFGGSLYAMTDPHYMMLLMKSLGEEYTVWDKAASIEFVKPGKGRVWAEFRLDESQLASIRAQTADGQKCLPEFVVDVKDAQGDLVCRVHKTLYVRKRRQEGRRI